MPTTGLLRQSVYIRLVVDADVNDTELLCNDPTCSLVGSEKTWDKSPALASRLRIFDTEMSAEEENLVGLALVNRALLGRAEAMDST